MMDKNIKAIPEDTLYEDAVAFACSEDFVSVSTLQRRLRIGYNRAVRLIDRLSEEGIITGKENGVIHKVLGRMQSDRWKKVGTDYENKYNFLTRSYLKNIYSGNDDQNVLLSPLSILVMLSILLTSTGGETRAEILSLVDDHAELTVVRNRARALSDLLEAGGKLFSANAVCVNEKIGDSIKFEFIDELKKYFSGELFRSEHMAGDVNQWVEQKTNGMINKIIDEDDNDRLACIVNAIAFESKWNEQYEDTQIWDEQFTNIDRSKLRTPMLHSEERLYIENDMCTGFIKNYKDCEYSFMGLLPVKSGKSQIHKLLREVDFTELFKSAESCDVGVTFPEFNYTCKYDISDICKDIGIHQAFTSDADFTPMCSEWLMIDRILHSARIELDRSGTKAAAVTLTDAFAGCAISFWERKEVKLNRPFVYAIMHNETKLPVFVGVVNHL